MSIKKTIALGMAIIAVSPAALSQPQTFRDSAGTTVVRGGAVGVSTKGSRVSGATGKSPHVLNAADVLIIPENVSKVINEMGITKGKKRVARCSTAQLNFSVFEAPYDYTYDGATNRWSAVKYTGIALAPNVGYTSQPGVTAGWIKHTERKNSTSTTTIHGFGYGIPKNKLTAAQAGGIIEKFFKKSQVVIPKVDLDIVISHKGYELNIGGVNQMADNSDIASISNTLIGREGNYSDDVLNYPNFYLPSFDDSTATRSCYRTGNGKDGREVCETVTTSAERVISPTLTYRPTIENQSLHIPNLINYRMGYATKGIGALSKNMLLKSIRHIQSGGKYSSVINLDLDVSVFKTKEGFSVFKQGYDYNVVKMVKAKHRYDDVRESKRDRLFQSVKATYPVSVAESPNYAAAKSGFNQKLTCTFGALEDV